MSKGIRRVARILGGISCGFFWGMFILIAIVSEGPSPSPAELMELLPMLVMLGIVLLAYILAYFPRKKGELVGGTIMIITGICMILYITLPKGLRVLSGALIYGVPFIIPGILFLFSYRKEKRKGAMVGG